MPTREEVRKRAKRLEISAKMGDFPLPDDKYLFKPLGADYVEDADRNIVRSTGAWLVRPETMRKLGKKLGFEPPKRGR